MKNKEHRQIADFGLPSLVMWGGNKAPRLHVAVSTHEGKAIDLRDANVSVSCFHRRQPRLWANPVPSNRAEREHGVI